MVFAKVWSDSGIGGTGRSVAEELRDLLLLSDRFPLHSRLPPERKLCNLLRVSRTALRQGLHELENQGLHELENDGRIWRHVGKGTFVGGRPQSVHSHPEALGADTTLSELLETRMLIEPQLARLAALRSEFSDLALIRRYEACALRAEDWTTWDHWDELFHRGVAEASGNGLLISIIDQILRVKKGTPWAITRAKTFDPDLRDRYSAEHASIVASIEAHDLEGAEKAMVRHIQRISSSIGPITSRNGPSRRPDVPALPDRSVDRGNAAEPLSPVSDRLHIQSGRRVRRSA